MKISFDIGGVLSKYTEVFRPLIKHLQDGGAEIYVITDIYDHDMSVKLVQDNGYNIPEDHILNSDYKKYGERCKSELIKEYGIHLHIDDFPGYCAHSSCVSLFVWPNSERPYYADDFITDCGEFGRRQKSIDIYNISLTNKEVDILYDIEAYVGINPEYKIEVERLLNLGLIEKTNDGYFISKLGTKYLLSRS